MKRVLTTFALAGLSAVAGAATIATSAQAAPASAVYTTWNGTTAAVVPVYYKCTKKGCGYFFYRKYGTPITYSYSYPFGYPFFPVISAPGTPVLPVLSVGLL